MADRIVRVEDGFWNVRGSFRIGGLLDIGTQCSLARLRAGGFVLIDSYTLHGDVLAEVQRITGGRIDAVINVHPFHTVHVRAVHAAFPEARLYGTLRHTKIAKDLPWQPEHTEGAALHSLFAEDFDFTVPAGVEFAPREPGRHFSSVLVHHRDSGALHVDDTLGYTKILGFGGVRLHPTLRQVLQPRPGAVAEFRAWGASLVERCRDVRHLCTAHTRKTLPAGEPVAQHVARAFELAEPVLRKHEARHG